MTSRTFASGRLESDGDTWMLVGSHVILLDLASDPSSIEHDQVSVVGHMGIPPSAPGILKLIVEKLASHDQIARRSFGIFQSSTQGSAEDHWVQAERELLTL